MLSQETTIEVGNEELLDVEAILPDEAENIAEEVEAVVEDMDEDEEPAEDEEESDEAAA